MHRLQYRNSVGHESLVVSHTVDVAGTVAGQAGVRYYELCRDLPGGSFTVNEQASWTPPANVHYWMPSAAMDHDGNLAVGYSRSGSGAADFPSLRYAARLASDPPGSLAQGEATLIDGTGLQTDASERWGDYAALSVDPEDDCTFWFTSEYYTSDNTCPTASGRCWHTRIGSFKLPECTALPTPGTIEGVVRNQLSNAPIAGAFVSANGYTTVSDGAGNYSLSVPAQTYTVQGSKFGYSPASVSGLLVTTGGTVTQDVLLPPLTLLALQSSAVDDSASNGNGVVESDECFGLAITVGAIGGGDATGVSAVLSSTTPGVTVTQDTSAYPNIPASNQAANTTPFVVSVAPGFLPGTPIQFSLQVSTDQGPFSLGLQLATGTPDPAAVNYSATGPVAIPDGSPTGASLTVNVAGLTSPISSVRVALRITHTWDSDLQIQLIGPDNTTITLAQGVGADGDNFGTDCPAGANDTNFDDAAVIPIGGGAAPFVGNFKPQQPLSTFLGKSGSAANGAWKVKAVDSVAQDTGSIQCVTLTINGYLAASGSGACAGDSPAMTAAALALDAGGNGVFEVGETVELAPTWSNGGTSSASNLGGALANFTGPGGPVYSIVDGSSFYGTVATGNQASCSGEADCYGLSVSGSRPSLHWDATVDETLSTGEAKTWSLHVGASFSDVPTTQPFYSSIEALLHADITGGCGGGAFCPEGPVTRAVAAYVLLRAKEGPDFNPPSCDVGGEMFPDDVPESDPFCPWVEEAATRQIMSACTIDGQSFCPGLVVTREQAAVYLLRTVDGVGVPPAACTEGNEPYDDVLFDSLYCRWIQEVKSRGISQGCGGNDYCPFGTVNRDVMAAVLRRALGLLLYEP